MVYALGYSGLPVSMKRDAVPELDEIRRQVAALRTAVPIDVPVRPSKGNGAVEKGVETWQGRLQTLKDQLEHGIGTEVPKDQPGLQWLDWWSELLLNSFALL